MAFAILARILGIVLFAAAVLKGRDLPVAQVHDPIFWNTHTLEMAAIVGEIGLGSLLLAGLFPQLSWWLSVIFFIATMGFGLDRALAGAESCGCFGTVRISPWYTAAFDFAAWLALLIFRPNNQTITGERTRVAIFVALLVVSMSAFGGFAFQKITSAKSQEGSELAVLPPDQWTGQQFPLLGYVDVGSRLKEGEWVVMFYHHRCARCQDSLARLLGMAHQYAGHFGAKRVALIEVPPFAEGQTAASQPTSWLSGRLDGQRKWHGLSPRFLQLRNGVVEVSTDSLDHLLATSGENQNSTAAENGDVLFPDYRRIRREMFLREIACGPLALLAVLRDLHVTLTPMEIDEHLAEAGSQGIDMLRLKHLAEARGLHALGVEVAPEQLRRLNRRAIVHLNGIGFAAVLGFVPGGVEVVYPLQSRGVIPTSVFDSAFGKQGIALLIDSEHLDPLKLRLTDRPVDGPSGPRLRLSRRILAAGRIHRKDWETAITIFNDGDATRSPRSRLKASEAAAGSSRRQWADRSPMKVCSISFATRRTNHVPENLHARMACLSWNAAAGGLVGAAQ